MKSVLQLLGALVLFLSFASSAQAVSCKTPIVAFASSQIEHYLQVHPQAADSLQGVHYFWITWPDQPEALVVTETALHCLQEQSIVESFNVGNNVLWRKHRTSEAHH